VRSLNSARLSRQRLVASGRGLSGNARSLIEETRTDEALHPMTDNLHPNSQGRWLHFKAMCRYVDLSPSAMTAKLIAGTGPRSYQSPGSRNKIFWSGDVDDWVVNAPERVLTQAERGRLIKLQEGAARVREERRARRQGKTEEVVTA
jgi:hypothetical protein